MPINFVGPAYALKQRKADVQRSINLMPTPVESGSGKARVFLKPAPGLGVFSAVPVIVVVVTSMPYPIAVVEDMDVSYAFSGGALQLAPFIDDEMDVGYSFASGELADVLVSYAIPPEEVDATYSFSSGVLTTVLLTYTVPAEEVDATYSFSAGDLTVVLLTYSYWPDEAMDATYGFASGVLS